MTAFLFCLKCKKLAVFAFTTSRTAAFTAIGAAVCTAIFSIGNDHDIFHFSRNGGGFLVFFHHRAVIVSCTVFAFFHRTRIAFTAIVFVATRCLFGCRSVLVFFHRARIAAFCTAISTAILRRSFSIGSAEGESRDCKSEDEQCRNCKKNSLFHIIPHI